MKLRPGQAIALGRAEYPKAIRIKHYWLRKAKRPRLFAIERIAEGKWMMRRVGPPQLGNGQA